MCAEVALLVLIDAGETQVPLGLLALIDHGETHVSLAYLRFSDRQLLKCTSVPNKPTNADLTLIPPCPQR
jgi:hypothetical protein